MEEPRKQNGSDGPNTDEGDFGMADPCNLHGKPIDDDDLIDDWISHVDDFDISDDLNTW